MIAERKLDFEVLFDSDNRFADELDLKHGFPAELKEVYGKFGINLDDFNGNTKWELPIPARFVVDSNGIVRAADINADYTVRPEPSHTVQVVASLGS